MGLATHRTPFLHFTMFLIMILQAWFGGVFVSLCLFFLGGRCVLLINLFIIFYFSLIGIPAPFAPQDIAGLWGLEIFCSVYLTLHATAISRQRLLSFSVVGAC